MMSKESKRGGARKGAGRKKGSGEGRKVVTKSFSLSPEAAANIESRAEETGKSASAVVDAWARKLKPKRG